MSVIWVIFWISVAALGVAALVYVGLVVLRVTVFAPDWIERSPSGLVRARRPHYHGDRQGHWTFWHEDGWRECAGEYVAGWESGTWTFYHPNGRPCARGEMDGWHRQGVWPFWDEAGSPLDEAAFRAHYGDTAERLPPRADEPGVGQSDRTEPGTPAARPRD